MNLSPDFDQTSAYCLVARQDDDGATFVNLRNDVTLGPCAGAGSRANLRAQTS